jgi:hypothetical protein
VLVEGSVDKPKYRIAHPGDRIVIRAEVEVLGHKYGPGELAIPPSGNLANGSK